MKNEKTLLDMYVSPDDVHPVLRAPFAQYENVYASDAHACIRVRKSVVENQYPASKTPNCSCIFIDTNREKTVTMQQLEKLLAGVERVEETRVVNERIECEECGGSGKVCWEYGEWERKFDCPKCNGEGYVEREDLIPTGKMLLDKFTPVKLGDRMFASGHIQTIMKTMELLEIHAVAMRYNEHAEKEQVVFNFSPDVDVLLMPVYKG
jgi:hypothetical protein